MKLFSKLGRKVQIVVTALVVGGTMLVTPGGQAHAADDNVRCRQDYENGYQGVYIFSDINFQGDCKLIIPTNNDKVDTWNYGSFGSVGNDRMSSIATIGTIDVYLYEHTDRSGQIYHVWGNSKVNDFTTQRMSGLKNLNDQVSSMTTFKFVW